MGRAELAEIEGVASTVALGLLTGAYAHAAGAFVNFIAPRPIHPVQKSCPIPGRRGSYQARNDQTCQFPDVALRRWLG